MEIFKDRLENHSNYQLFMFVLVVPDNGKYIYIVSITKTANDVSEKSILCLLKTGTESFTISGSTCHSRLYLHINQQYCDLGGGLFTEFQFYLAGINIIIIDEASVVGKNLLLHVDKHLRQASRKLVKPFEVFEVIFVGDFQQLPPFDDTPIHIEDEHTTFLLYHSINNFLFLEKIQMQVDDDPDSEKN